MTEQDKIRRSALKKYIKYLKCELKRLNDGGMHDTRLSFLDFEPEPPIKDGFEPEELKEIEYLFEKLKDVKQLELFCKRNEIDLNKYSKIIWN